ncbi:MAG: hypothetical protein MOIL_01322 [Candidatus Methanolliviera sp. GoM_oil]|nr:MAG: hypothetical protein MOIL_01322 [Candidatus Methanolliviera sp. GoM_oil]
MAEEKGVFGAYSDAFRLWSDMASSWMKSANVFSMPHGDTGDLFRPFLGYFGDWSKMYDSFMNATQDIFPPRGALKDYTDVMMGGIDAYIKIYDTWIKNVDRVGRAGYEFATGSISGKEINMEEILTTMRGFYDDMLGSLVEPLESLPFSDINVVKEAVEKFLSAFPDEEKQVREFFDGCFNYTIKTMNDWNSMIKSASKDYADGIGRGELSVEPYQKMIKMCSETYSGLLKALKPSLGPEYNYLTEDLVEWAGKYLDMTSSMFEIPMKLYQGVWKSFSDVSKYIEEMSGEEIGSTGDLYDRWSKFHRRLSSDLMKTANFSTTVPDFIDKLVDYTKSTDALCEKLIASPYAAKKEVSDIHEAIKTETAEAIRRETAEAIRRETAEAVKLEEKVKRVVKK